MHFLFLDPDIGFIAKVAGKPTLEQMYQMLDCRLITAAHLMGTNDVLIVDDEGLFTTRDFLAVDQSELWVNQPGNQQTLRGRAIYIGTSPDGESVEPEHTFCFDALEPAGNERQYVAEDGKQVIAKIYGLALMDESYYRLPFSAKMVDQGTLAEQSIDEIINFYKTMTHET